MARADSYKSTSCLPDPICLSYISNLTDLSRVQTNATDYVGNVTAYDWIGECGISPYVLTLELELKTHSEYGEPSTERGWNEVDTDREG